MNNAYKIIFNKSTGQLVVTSELAKGNKKTRSSRGMNVSKQLLTTAVFTISSGFGILANAYAADLNVYESYTSGALIKDIDGKVTGIDGTNSANHKGKDQSVSSGNNTFKLNSNVKWLPDPDGPKTALPVEYKSASTLHDLGALTVKDKDGNPVEPLPSFQDWNLANKQDTITWVKEDGTTGTTTVFNIDGIDTVGNIDTATSFTAQIITGQPTEPFLDLRIATAKNTGTVLDINADQAIDWKPGQVKQSSLFSSEDGATINQNQDIKVTFAYTESVSNPADAEIKTGSFGPGKALSGATISFQGQDYTIDSKENLNNYNNVLIAAIQNNSLAATDYDAQINKAFKNGDKIYTYEYDPLLLNYDAQGYYFSDAMKAAVGKRSIFEASKDGVVNLNKNVEAIGDTWHRAYNVWAHDKGIVNNNGKVIVVSPFTQNALIESGSKFTNKGIITFDAKNDKGNNVTNWADQVKDQGSTYTNEGTINISNAVKNNANASHPNEYYKLSRSIATEVLNGASAINTASGVYNIGSTTGSVEGTATGVHVNKSGSFINEGVMNVIATTGGAKDDNLNLNVTNNAISIIADNTESSTTVINNGSINIAENAVNSAGINIAQSTAGVTKLDVVNEGTIKVGGKNSAGIKAAGDIKASSGNNILNKGTIEVTNSGSAGIFAASGAEVTNEGLISVKGKDDASARVYGIKNDNAQVTLNKGSEITVEGSYSTGLYARTGGLIIVEEGAKVSVPKDENAKQQVVFWISGKNAEARSSVIVFKNPAEFDLDNQSSTLFRIDNGATYAGSHENNKNLVVNVNGDNSIGYSIATKGTKFSSGVSTINVNGDGSTGINVNSGAGTDNSVTLNKETIITVAGNQATIATVDGNTYNLLGNKTGQDGAKLISEAILTSTGSNSTVAENAIGYKVVNTGQLVQKGTIDFSTAKNTTGVYIDGGTLTNEGSITSNGIGIDVYQTDAKIPSTVNNSSNITAVDGTAAIRLNENASLTVGGIGTITGQKSADAIRVMSGSNLTTKAANIVVDGSGSGIHFLNTAKDAEGTFKLSGTGTITVSGDNAAGITLEGQDAGGNPTMSNSNLDTRGSEGLIINVNDVGGNGIVTNTSGTVKSGTSVNIKSADGQSALVVKGTTSYIEQTGNLTSNATTSPVVDLTQTKGTAPITFINSGNIISNSGTLAVDASSQTVAVTIENKGTGKIVGGVVVGDAANTILLENNSTVDSITTGNGDNQIMVKDAASAGILTAGDGNDTVNLKDNSKTNQVTLGDGKNQITVSNTATVSGTIAAGDGNNTVNLKDSSTTNQVTLGGGANQITVSDKATVSGTITAGDGDNTVTLKDSSKTNEVALGNGTNTVNIYGGTDNGNIHSGSGNDSYTLINSTKNGSGILFDQIDAGDGDDLLTLNNSYYQMTDTGQVKNFENLHITDGSTFEANNVDLQLLGDGTTTKVVDLDKGGTYFINFDKTASDYLLTQSVKGAGTIKTDTNGHAFDFGNADYTQENFTGTLALGNGTFAIQGDNTKALTNATLQLDNGGIATVKADNGIQKMGGLTFNKGTLNFEKSFVGSKEQQLDSHIEVKDLDVSKSGTVNLVTNGFDNDYTEEEFLADVNSKTLLEQDDGINLVTLVQATNSVTGDAANIVVNMIDVTTGELLEKPNAKQDIRQAGSVVAIGDYGIGTSTYNDVGIQDGLYAAYILKKVSILDGETLNLETTPDSVGKGEDFRAQISDLDGGSGNIIIHSNNNQITLSNSSNDYTGSTTVSKGILNLGADNVLGQEDKHTSNLILNAGTKTTFNNTTQYVGEVNTAENSILALDTGTLNVDNGGIVDGHITSEQAATLNVNGGTLNVNGANQGYHGQTNIAQNAVVNINNVQSLGDGNIDVAGDLNINDASGVFVNNLSNAGNVNVNGTSDVVLDDDNSEFTGNFNITKNAALTASAIQHLGQSVVNNEGKLTLTGSDDWTVNNTVQGTGDVYKTGDNDIELTGNAAQYTGKTYVQSGSLIVGNSKQSVDLQSQLVDISANATFAGYGSVAGDVDNKGTFIVGGLDKENLTAATSYLVNGNFSNFGKIVLGSATGTGSKLNVGGNYTANGGSLYLNSVLNEGFEATETDQMVVGGNVVLGAGGATSIYVKPVGGAGAYTQPDAIKVVDVAGTSDKDAFTLGSPVAIGIYEYKLYKGRTDDSWYLSSFDPVYPPDEGHFVNPIIGAYLANQNALSMFNMTLHDRLGEPQYAESLKSDSAAKSMWIRSVINSARYNVVNEQLKLDGDSQVVQIGSDIIHWDRWQNNGKDYRARVGVMGGFGQSNFDSASRRTGTTANASIDNAYSAGIYGTIYQDSDRPLDSYVDAWALYNWYNDNKVSMDGYETTKYDSEGFNVSLEIGHTFLAKESDDKIKQWQFQPQVQMVYGQLRSDGNVHESGLVVDKSKTKSLESRVGGRMTYVDTSKVNQVQPFVEMNWLRQYEDQNLVFNDVYSFDNGYPANRYQLKIGFEGNTTRNWNGWGNVSYTVGDQSYKEVKAMAGFKYQW